MTIHMPQHGSYHEARAAESRPPATLLEILRSRPQIHPRELPQIRRLISDSENGLTQLEVQIQETIQTLQRLQQQWGELTAISEVYQTLSAPIRSLPTELLAKIFIFCLPEVSWAHEDPIPTHVPVVAQVSHHWRYVALSSPELWAGMSFILGRTRNPLGLRTLAERWISRSGHHPIDISIHVGSNQFSVLPEFDALALDAFLEAFIPHSDRWRKFRLRLLDPEMLSRGSQLDRVRGRVSSLEELDLGRTMLHQVTYRTLVLRRLVFHKTFEIAPRLKTVKITSPGSIDLPWKQITSWHSREVSVDMCIKRLTHTLNLTTAWIEFEDFKSLATQNLPSIPQLPFLSSLTINILHSDNLSTLLPALDLPALSQLSISTHSAVMWPTDTIVSFLGRSPLLQKLSFYHLAMSSRDLAQVLRQTPSLTELCVQHWDHVDDHLIQRLTLNSDGGPNLIPNLEVLTFKGGIFFRDQKLIPMITSRRIARQHEDNTTMVLKLLHLDYDRDIRMEDIGSSLISRLRSLEHQPDCNGPKITIQRGSVDIDRFYFLPSQVIDLAAHHQFHATYRQD